MARKPLSPPPLRRDPSLIPLSHQHQHGLALTVMIERGLRDEPSSRKADELAEKVRRFAEGELFGHFQVEEASLFPSARPFLESGKILDRLIAEHRAIEDLVERIAAAGGEDRIRLLREFGEILRHHIRAEERELFQEIQARLGPSRLAEVGREIAVGIEVACPLGSG